MHSRTTVPERFRTHAGHIDVARLKAEIRLSDIASMVTKLRPAGDQLKGLCPLHEERTASFYVDNAKGVWYCHGCQASGDVVTLVRIMGKQTFLEACEWLVGSEYTCLPDHQQSVRVAAGRRALNVGLAKAEWRSATSIAGTLAATYLAGRSLEGAIPGSVRFGYVPRWYDKATGEAGPRYPAMISACQDVDGSVTGIQRLFLTNFAAKSTNGAPRLSLGQIRGGALRLGPEASQIILCEGVEDGLSLMKMFPQTSVWVALGAGNMAHVVMPANVKHVVLAGDNDPTGRAAVSLAREAFELCMLQVDEIYPDNPFLDFNEAYMAGQTGSGPG